MSKFSDWTLAKLDKRFGLKQIRHSQTLDRWISPSIEVTDFETQLLEKLNHVLVHNVDNWNEQELSLHFIGPMFTLVDFTSDRFNLFAQRDLSGIVDGETLSANPDGRLASGWREPEIPYFCLQEYRKEKDPNGDPTGQCLAAMLVAQELNQNQHPVYGCYIIGRHWYFMVLEAKIYAISDSYTATREQIQDIFCILQKLKLIILGLIEQPCPS